MRVLLVTQPTTAGVGRCVLELASHGVSSGFEVTVASPRTEGFRRRVLATGARWVELPLSRQPAPIRDVRAVLSLRRGSRPFQIVHLHSSKAGAVGRVAWAGAHARPGVIFTPHAWSWHVQAGHRRSYKAVERRLAPLADAVVCSSQGEAEEARNALGDPPNLRVIRNGVDPARFRPSGPVAPRDRGRPLLVCVGRLCRQKGQDVALDALAHLTSVDPVLRFVGSGPWESALKDRTRELGLVNVEFIGSVDDPSPHMRAADLVIAPSRYETLSIAMLEAMSLAKPIVATRVAGAEELPPGAPVVPVGDAAGLASAVEMLLGQPERARDLGAAARATIKERLSLDRYLSSYMDLWSEVAATRQRLGSR